MKPPAKGIRVAISPRANTVGHNVNPTKVNASISGMGPATLSPWPAPMKRPVPIALPIDRHCLACIFEPLSELIVSREVGSYDIRMFSLLLRSHRTGSKKGD